jgi:hypothetical protein
MLIMVNFRKSSLSFSPKIAHFDFKICLDLIKVFTKFPNFSIATQNRYKVYYC